MFRDSSYLTQGARRMALRSHVLESVKIRSNGLVVFRGLVNLRPESFIDAMNIAFPPLLKSV